MENIKKNKNGGGLGSINEEEEEKESIKSGLSDKRPKKDTLAPNKSDVSEGGGNQRSASAKALSNLGGGGGAQISAEYQAELDQKFLDIGRTIEDMKDEQQRMQQAIDKNANDLTLSKVNAMQQSPSAKDTKADKQAAANTEEIKKDIKKLEDSIRNLNDKFSRELQDMRDMQNVGAGGGGDDNKAA